MERANDYSELTEELQQSLKRYRYTEREELQLRDVGTVHLIMTKRRRMVRYVCAVLEAPEDVSSVGQCRHLVQRLREGLAVQYARFPYFKELETFAVLLCRHAVYEALSPELSAFYDRTGLHMNVIAGLVLVDRDRFEACGEKTWGLFYSGRHFRAIGQTVQQWCQARRKAP